MYKRQLNRRADIDDADLFADTTFVATFSKAPEPEKDWSGYTYAVSYLAEDNGSVDTEINQDLTATSTKGVTGATATPDEGYLFNGWYLRIEAADGSTSDKRLEGIGEVLSAEDAIKNLNLLAEATASNKTVYDNTMFVAKFRLDPGPTYTISYKVEGEGTVSNEEDADIPVAGNQGISGSVATAKEGYDFLGWYKRVEGSDDEPVSYTHLDVYKRQNLDWVTKVTNVREPAMWDKYNYQVYRVETINQSQDEDTIIDFMRYTCLLYTSRCV